MVSDIRVEAGLAKGSLGDSTVFQRKAEYEAFTHRAVRSDMFAELVRNNRAYRHVGRFLFHVVLVAALSLGESLLTKLPIVLGMAAYMLFLHVHGLVVAGMMVHAHELSHDHIKKKWVNDLIGILSGLACFINFYSFQFAHRFHHQNIGNMDAPESGAPVSPTGQAKLRNGDLGDKLMARVATWSPYLWMLTAWPIHVVFGDYSSWLLPFRHRGRWDGKSIAVFAFMALVHGALMVASPFHYLFLVALPGVVGGSRILAVTYLHHAHEDSVFFNSKHHNFFSVVMANTDRDYGPVVNFFMLNNGYHIPHHMNPHIAYYDLPRASAYLRGTIPEGLKYNSYPESDLFRDLAAGQYEKRLEVDCDWVQIAYRSSSAQNSSVRPAVGGLTHA